MNPAFLSSAFSDFVEASFRTERERDRRGDGHAEHWRPGRIEDKPRAPGRHRVQRARQSGASG